MKRLFPGLNYWRFLSEMSCLNTARMAFQVRIRINGNTIEDLGVASSYEQFEKLTIRELKEKSLRLFPGVNFSNRPRVIFVNNELEDDQTFKSCSIQPLSVLVVVLRMPDGEDSPHERIRWVDSMESLPPSMKMC